MSNFTGSKCIICENEFNDNDDIVVCPECGTPYHRECYQKEGKCVNVDFMTKAKAGLIASMQIMKIHVRNALTAEL